MSSQGFRSPHGHHVNAIDNASSHVSHRAFTLWGQGDYPLASGGPAGGQTFKKLDKQVLNSLLKAPPVHFYISPQYMAFIAQRAMKAMHWCEVIKMYRRSLEKSPEALFVKLFKSLAPGRAAGGTKARNIREPGVQGIYPLAAGGYTLLSLAAKNPSILCRWGRVATYPSGVMSASAPLGTASNGSIIRKSECFSRKA